MAVLYITGYLLITIITGSVIAYWLDKDTGYDDTSRFPAAAAIAIFWPVVVPICLIGLAIWIVNRKITNILNKVF